MNILFQQVAQANWIDKVLDKWVSSSDESYLFLTLAIIVIIGLSSAIGFLFYLYRSSYNERIADRDKWMEKLEAFQKDYYGLKLRTCEVLESLTKSFEVNNRGNERLISVLERSYTENLQKKLKEMEEKNGKKEVKKCLDS